MRMNISLLALLLAFPSYAQTSRGTVTGTVLDGSGLVILGCAVELTNRDTDIARTVFTNEAGIYRFDAVDLGTYVIKTQMPGFKTFLHEPFPVEANRTITIDAILQPGIVAETVDVIGATTTLLTKEAPLRGGSMAGNELVRLPLAYLDPFYAGSLPGVIYPQANVFFTSVMSVSVNGQRPRGNNFMLDGTDNNDVGFGGISQAFRITDAIQETSVQTSNFGAEFGRAGGGVFNLVTKSGTNKFHGTLNWRILSQALDSMENTLKLNTPPGDIPKKPVYTENIYGFTLGGPIIKDKTFFFGGFQQDSRRSTASYYSVIPTEDAVAKLKLLFPNNPRLNFYLDAIGSERGAANPVDVVLGQDPGTGLDRGTVRFASRYFPLPGGYGWPQWMLRLDHSLSARHRLSFRHVYESYTFVGGYWFPGYYSDYKRRYQNFLFSDNYTLSSTWTNEFRFSYARLGWENRISPNSVPEAATMPLLSIPNIGAPGIGPTVPQFQYINKWLFQETQSKLIGRHTFRFGFELLWQLSKERPLFNERGAIFYQNSADPAYSAFANFLDDFSGPSGNSVRNFGEAVIYPDQLRQSYFLQDAWKLHPSFTLTLGLRYENYGSPANALKYPAFAGFDPSKFLEPIKVNSDNNNFGPSFGFAWSPRAKSGLASKLFGDGKTVWRGGFQVSYDAFFDFMLANIQADSPNSVATYFIGAGTGRGTANFFSTLPKVARPVMLTDAQTSVFDPNIRNPYTERWSLGFQRQLPRQFLFDLSYVGSASHKLFTSEDVNVRQPDGTRLHPDFGVRQIRTSQGNSNYHSLQARIERRFAKMLYLTGSYNWSRMIDSTSELYQAWNTYGTSINIGSFAPALTSMPVNQGGLRLDRALSDYNRSHTLVISFSWDIPGPKQGLLGYLAGGWNLSGLTGAGSGAPYTVLNGYDRNNDGVAADRPDIGNPNAPLNTRAILSTACSTGYVNPDTMGCVASNDVRFIQGAGLPNSKTVGRNTLSVAGGMQTWLTILKAFSFKESRKLEFGLEAYNLFNNPGYPYIPSASVVGSYGPSGNMPSRFLNKDYTMSNIRNMSIRAKLIF
jgi:hypothetical protein